LSEKVDGDLGLLHRVFHGSHREGWVRIREGGNDVILRRAYGALCFVAAVHSGGHKFRDQVFLGQEVMEGGGNFVVHAHSAWGDVVSLEKCEDRAESGD